jgi:hypothetical protein
MSDQLNLLATTALVLSVNRSPRANDIAKTLLTLSTADTAMRTRRKKRGVIDLTGSDGENALREENKMLKTENNSLTKLVAFYKDSASGYKENCKTVVDAAKAKYKEKEILLVSAMEEACSKEIKRVLARNELLERKVDELEKEKKDLCDQGFKIMIKELMHLAEISRLKEESARLKEELARLKEEFA